MSDSLFPTTTEGMDITVPDVPLGDIQTSEIEKQVKEFNEFMNGPESPPKTQYHSNVSHIHSSLTEQEISKLAEKLISNKGPLPTEPAVIADLIECLSEMRVKSLEQSDYMRSKRIVELIEQLRLAHRQRDRVQMFEEHVEQLKQKVIEAETSLKAVQDSWKGREKEYQDTVKQENTELRIKQQRQEDDFNAEWQDDSKIRKYNKRSKFLLQQIQIEKALALTGDFDKAQEIRKQNERYEKTEATQKYHEMVGAYESKRRKLIEEQEVQRKELQREQEFRFACIQKAYQEELDLANRRYQAAKKALEMESDINKFIAKKFKKSADVVLPVSVTVSGGNDVLTSDKVKSVTQLKKFREAPQVAPLTLPPLNVKKITKRRTK